METSPPQRADVCATCTSMRPALEQNKSAASASSMAETVEGSMDALCTMLRVHSSGSLTWSGRLACASRGPVMGYWVCLYWCMRSVVPGAIKCRHGHDCAAACTRKTRFRSTTAQCNTHCAALHVRFQSHTRPPVRSASVHCASRAREHQQHQAYAHVSGQRHLEMPGAWHESMWQLEFIRCWRRCQSCLQLSEPEGRPHCI